MKSDNFPEIYKAFYKSLLENSIDPIIVIDSEGRALFYNKAAEKLFGYKAKEVLGKEIHHILAPKEYHQAYREGFERFKKTGKGKVINKVLELEAITKKGEIIPIELSLSRVKQDNQIFILGVIRNIRKRRKLQKDLTDLFKGILLALKKLVELRDFYTAIHQRRVTNLAIRLAQHLKID